MKTIQQIQELVAQEQRTEIEIREEARRLDIMCDRCDGELYDIQPSSTLTSNPPCLWAECNMCGRSVTLPLVARRLARERAKRKYEDERDEDLR